MASRKGNPPSSNPTDLVLTRTANLFGALANEARLRAVLALARSGPLTVTELLPRCGLEKTALSHQLRHLRLAGLVVAERSGKNVVYALADAHITCILDDGMEHASEPTRRLAPSTKPTKPTKATPKKKAAR